MPDISAAVLKGSWTTARTPALSAARYVSTSVSSVEKDDRRMRTRAHRLVRPAGGGRAGRVGDKQNVARRSGAPEHAVS